jgi:hypothetical protein
MRQLQRYEGGDIVSKTAADWPNSPWPQACRYADAVAEEGGIEHATAAAGIDIEELAHVAKQRALRALMLHTGRMMEFAATSLGIPTQLRLSPEEREWLIIASAIAMDGMFIGWRARMLTEAAEADEGGER